MVLAEPAPMAFLVNFGDSSLDYEVRVFVKEPARRAPVASSLHMSINEALRRNNIEIPFPQRDMHIKDIDPSLLVREPATESGA
jgi:potassium efflux system protein